MCEVRTSFLSKDKCQKFSKLIRKRIFDHELVLIIKWWSSTFSLQNVSLSITPHSDVLGKIIGSQAVSEEEPSLRPAETGGRDQAVAQSAGAGRSLPWPLPSLVPRPQRMEARQCSSVRNEMTSLRTWNLNMILYSSVFCGAMNTSISHFQTT